MKRLFLLLTLALLSSAPAFAQDDGGFLDVNDLFGGNAGGGAGNIPEMPKLDLTEIRNLLAKAGARPMDNNQEKQLNKVYKKESGLMERSFEKQFGVPLATALALQSPARGRGGRGGAGGGGGRGGGGTRGGGGSRGGPRVTPQQAAEITRLTGQLQDKLLAALRIDQQSKIRTFQSEELRTSRLILLTQSMDAAGRPLTTEQKSQAEDLYSRESRLRTLIIVEAKGRPHQAKVAQLETETTQGIAKLLDPTQKLVLSQAMARTKSR